MTRLEPGLEFLPHLTLVEPLGSGGMGEVWVARDARRGEDVVAKILPADASDDRVALLRREARLVRKLKHPGIVPVYGFESGSHGSAILLRCMRGGDASGLRDASPRQIVCLGREIAEALGYLHGMGVVHRDVKATNVLLDEKGRAHIADFGIAAVESPDDDEGVTLHGGGSRASMSPQQRQGAPPSPEDDVYSLGVLLYELLGGHPPFSAAASDEEIRTVAPPPFETAHPVPSGLRPLIASMLAKDPRERPGEMRQVESALRDMEASLATLSPTAPQQAPRLEPPPAPVAPPAEVRLQPPPRASDVIAPIPDPPRAPVLTSRPPSSRRLPRAQTLLLAALGLAAVFVVLVLPRWAASPDPASSPEISEEPSAEIEATPAPTPAPVADSASTPEASPFPVEATPEPGAAAGTPAPRPRPAEPPKQDPAQAQARRRSQELGAALSSVHAALEREDWPAARQALAQASALGPGSPAVVDARRRLEEGERTAALAQQRKAARAFEEKEDWRRAVAEYDAALRLDGAVAFALEGRTRAAARAGLAEKLDYHIAHPLRLATDRVAAEAEVLLQEASEVDSPGPRHRRQVASLVRALDAARTSVPIVLESDGETEVVVHKVGRLGAFERKTLELRPGTYTVVGKRSGYRDVRRQLVVEPNGPPPPLVVRCEEEI